MRSVGAATYRDYLALLERDPREPEALFRRLTIHVTEFFRDPEVYQALREKVLPAIEAQADSVQGPWTLRAWSAGCSTGEEPYSLAILLSEWVSRRPGWDFRILATDIDEPSVSTAIRGEYPETAVAKVPPEFGTGHWVREGGRVVVSTALRGAIRFEVHDLLGPWPADRSGFDLILCRNLLIYLGAAQQQVLYGRFHEALKPRGHLVLGRTEALLGRARQLYECVDIPHRFYRTLERPAPAGNDGNEGGK